MPWAVLEIDSKQSGWDAFCDDILEVDFFSRSDHFIREKYVSIWIAAFPDQKTFQMYSDQVENWDIGSGEDESWPFVDDLGIDPLFDDWQFAQFVAGEEVSIARLLEGLPYVSSFSERVLEVCQHLNLNSGSGVICKYDWDFFGLEAFGPFAFGHVRYIGSFRYDINSNNGK